MEIINRLTSMSVTGGTNILVAYDGVDNVLNYVEPVQRKSRFKYDGLGRVTRVA